MFCAQRLSLSHDTPLVYQAPSSDTTTGLPVKANFEAKQCVPQTLKSPETNVASDPRCEISGGRLSCNSYEDKNHCHTGGVRHYQEG
jgi:hypothetical protein